jgi:HAD superfamily hydrolase (TIGR01509 family)
LHHAIDRTNKRAEQKELFQKHLKEIDGITPLLNRLNHRMAIASGSDIDRLEFTLKLTNLWDRFSPHVYSSTLVTNGKPAPDIFLYAANELNTQPSNCWVIEDSENGVRAGKAAGMKVIGFVGGSHITHKDEHALKLQKLGADYIIHHIQDAFKILN